MDVPNGRRDEVVSLEKVLLVHLGPMRVRRRSVLPFGKRNAKRCVGVSVCPGGLVKQVLTGAGDSGGGVDD